MNEEAIQVSENVFADFEAAFRELLAREAGKKNRGEPNNEAEHLSQINIENLTVQDKKMFLKISGEDFPTREEFRVYEKGILEDETGGSRGAYNLTSRQYLLAYLAKQYAGHFTQKSRKAA